jgi:hypothetical protein
MQHSTLNAHYTSVEIARAIWRALLRMGYGTLRAPRVLEPSAGTGVFLGTIPLDESDTIMDRVIAVELDAVDGEGGSLERRCLSLLDAEVEALGRSGRRRGFGGDVAGFSCGVDQD